MTKRTRSLTIVVALMVIAMLAIILPAAALAAPPTVISGPLHIPGGTSASYPFGVIITATGDPYTDAGYSLTMTVNGVEKGQVLETTDGYNLIFVPGTYMGKVVFTAAEANIVTYQPGGPPGTPTVDHPFRQALYVNEGPDMSLSVPSALVGGTVGLNSAKNVKISSTGECFNGIFVAGGEYLLKGLKLTMIGNGRSDFSGYGAAIMGTGADTTLVIDGAKITTDGIARPAVVADKGANVIVKNSTIAVNNGVFPADLVPTIDTTIMREVPWMLGLTGNCRATNLLGTDTKASYINSTISAEGWGVLSTDGCLNPFLTAINSTIRITGEDGYGSYGIGNATERFLGCTFDVGTYATISRGSRLYYGDSNSTVVAQLNADLGLGLTARELKTIRSKHTSVYSDRFGIMWHGGGTLDIGSGTQFSTKETTFLDKGQAVQITATSANLTPKNGVIFQLMDDDDAGPNMGLGGVTNNVYHEPTGPVALNAGHDAYEWTVPAFMMNPMGGEWTGDASIMLTKMTVRGNFFNGMRGDIAGPFGPPAARNMGVGCDNVKLTGQITSSTATHGDRTTIVYPRFFYDGDSYGSTEDAVPGDYKYLGEVTNTPSETVNNGVFVWLVNNSKWTVTGDCYLTELSIDASSRIAPALGYSMTVYVGGVAQAIIPGGVYDFNSGDQIFIDLN